MGGCRVDATYLVTWYRHKTGTQRVVTDFIAAYAGLTEIQLFWFSQRWQRFVALRTEDLLARMRPPARLGTAGGRSGRRPTSDPVT